MKRFSLLYSMLSLSPQPVTRSFPRNQSTNQVKYDYWSGIFRLKVKSRECCIFFAIRSSQKSERRLLSSDAATMAKQGTANHRPEEMRQRVNLFLSKLSDRDTEAMAAAELDAITRSLTADALPPFVSAVADTRPSDKTPLRRHSLRLFSLLSHSVPPSALAPHLPRILSAAIRRLRDPDSSVRSAVVDAVRSLAAASPPQTLVTSLLHPLADALFHEQDQHPQSAAALSLSAALDESNAATADDLPAYLHRLLPRLVKLTRTPSFKAKPALLTLVASAASAGSGAGDAALQALVPCLVEFLGSEDWAARRAAAEALTRLATSQRDRLGRFKPSCLASFEARRYDKVKIVRESMNRMLEVWKEIPDRDLDAPQPSSQSQPCSVKETVSDGRFPATSIKISSAAQSPSPFIARKSRQPTNRSPPPAASPLPTGKKIVPLDGERKPISALQGRMGQGKNLDWRIEIAVPDAPHSVLSEDKLAGSKEKDVKNGEQRRSRLEGRRVLFEKNSEEKKTGVRKSGAQVVPFQENGSSEVTGETCGADDDLLGLQKSSDLSLIRMQLVQIENQQSSLLELLQRFMGNSQSGIRSLETRVHSLEITLEEISRDLAVSSARVSNNNPAAKACCRLPGTEFLSSKFWRRTDDRYASRFFTGVHEIGNRDDHESYKWDKHKFGPRGGFTNPLAETNPRSRGCLQITQTKMQDNGICGTRWKHVYDC